MSFEQFCVGGIRGEGHQYLLYTGPRIWCYGPGYHHEQLNWRESEIRKLLNMYEKVMQSH